MVYAVMDVRTRELVYTGPCVSQAARELIPGTVHASGECTAEAIYAVTAASLQCLRHYEVPQ